MKEGREALERILKDSNVFLLGSEQEAKQTEEVPKHKTVPKEEWDSKEDSDMVLMLSWWDSEEKVI